MQRSTCASKIVEANTACFLVYRKQHPFPRLYSGAGIVIYWYLYVDAVTGEKPSRDASLCVMNIAGCGNRGLAALARAKLKRMQNYQNCIQYLESATTWQKTSGIARHVRQDGYINARQSGVDQRTLRF